MSNGLLAALFVAVWVISGLTTAIFFHGRAGRRSPFWYGISIILGPFSLPIGWEMSRDRSTQVVERETALPPVGTTPRGQQLAAVRLLVGVDGSPEARDALLSAVCVLGNRIGSLVLVHVVDYDAAVMEREEATRAGHDLLAEVASHLPAGTQAPAIEVAVGRPPDALLDLAERESADLLVVGHRGQGLSRAVLGSVCDEVVRRSDLPVLVGGRACPDGS